MSFGSFWDGTHLTEGRHIGPGHPSLLRREGKEWLAHHFYDGENRGRSRLRLVELRWAECSWPEVVDGRL